MDALGSLTVDFVQLTPLLVFDCFTSIHELVDQPRVMVGKVDIGDTAIIISAELLQPLFKKLFEPEFDLKTI